MHVSYRRIGPLRFPFSPGFHQIPEKFRLCWQNEQRPLPSITPTEVCPMDFPGIVRRAGSFICVVPALFLFQSTVAQDAFFRSNTTHTGVFGAPGVPEFHRLKWQFHSKAAILSSPTVSGDTVYVGSSDHKFYAIDLASGLQKWEFKTGGRVQGSAAVSNGTVFFESYDSNFY